MTTPLTRVADMPQVWWPLPGFARMVSLVEAARDVLTEADRMACAARERYPFAD